MFDSSIGALLVGVVVGTFFFGMTTTQTYLYYQLFPEDSKWTKCLVAWVWFLELVHNTSSIQALYQYTVTNFGNPDIGIMKVPVALGFNLFVAEVIALFVQGYFIFKIRKFSRGWYIAAICHFLLLVRFAGNTAASVKAMTMTRLDIYLEKFHWLMLTNLSIGAFADLAIPFILVYYLMVHRSAAQRSTLAIVDKLIMWTIQTCLLTGLMASLILICFLAIPHTFGWIAVMTVLPKAFSNSFLANLNSRVKLRAMQESTEVVEMFPSNSDQRNTIHFPHKLGARVTVTTQEIKAADADADFDNVKSSPILGEPYTSRFSGRDEVINITSQRELGDS